MCLSKGTVTNGVNFGVDKETLRIMCTVIFSTDTRKGVCSYSSYRHFPSEDFDRPDTPRPKNLCYSLHRKVERYLKKDTVPRLNP